MSSSAACAFGVVSGKHRPGCAVQGPRDLDLRPLFQVPQLSLLYFGQPFSVYIIPLDFVRDNPRIIKSLLCCLLLIT